jgi:enoyl-CoA hydratase
VCALGERFGARGPAHADLILSEDELATTLEVIERSPRAAATLALLLRTLPAVEVDQGLAMESAAYSLLQAGPEFAAWRATASKTADAATGPVVAVERDGQELTIRLDRPDRHNAITAQLRDELYEALSLAVVDDSLTSVHLRGNGRSFCSGGDLDEFGDRPDPATAHITRLARSPARLIDRLGRRITAHVHGSTLGGGIEMAAFAGLVTAHPETTIGLPEIELGLIPGAGGTVSLTRRIGRQRTAALALTGRRIDARLALDWGIVDVITDST